MIADDSAERSRAVIGSIVNRDGVAATELVTNKLAGFEPAEISASMVALLPSRFNVAPFPTFAELVSVTLPVFGSHY